MVLFGYPLALILVATINPLQDANPPLTITHSISVANNCKPGSYIDVTIELSYSGNSPLLSLGLKEIIPPGTSYYGIVSGNAPHIQPTFGTAEELDFAWIFPPQMPTSFVYRLKIDSLLEAENFITGIGLYGTIEENLETPPFTSSFTCPIIEGEAPSEGEGSSEGEVEGEQSNEVNFTLSTFGELTYLPEDIKEIVVTISYSPTLGITALGAKIFLPESWEYQGLKEGNYLPQIAPQSGTTKEVDFAWITIPPSGTIFSFLVKAGVDITPTKSISGYGMYRILGGQINTPSSNLIFNVGPLPDLAFISGTLSPNTVFNGGIFEVSYTLENTGNLPIDFNWIDCIYISDDNILDDNDYLLTCINQQKTIAPLETTETHSYIRLPDNLTGTFYVMLKANYHDSFYEFTKANNDGTLGLIDVLKREYGIKLTPLISTAPAGSPVRFKIQTYYTESETPLPHQPVSMRFSHRFLETTQTIYTDENGDYIYSYDPLQTEGGIFTLEAKLPQEIYYPYKVEAKLRGIGVSPSQVVIPYIPKKPISIPITIVNLGDETETNLSINYTGLPQNWNLDYQIPNRIDGNTYAKGEVIIYPESLLDNNSNIEIFIHSSEGSENWIECTLISPINVPKIEVSPSLININLTNDEAKIVNLEIRNSGGIDTGKIEISIVPDNEFINLITNGTINNIKPGESYFASFQILNQQKNKTLIQESSIVLSSELTEDITIPIKIYDAIEPQIKLKVSDITTSEPIKKGQIIILTNEKLFYTYSLNPQGEAIINSDIDNIESISCVSSGYRPYTFVPLNNKLFNDTIEIRLEKIPVYLKFSFLDTNEGLSLKNIKHINFHNEQLLPEFEIFPTYIHSELNTNSLRKLSIKNNSDDVIKDILVFPKLSVDREIVPIVKYIDEIPPSELVEIPFTISEEPSLTFENQICGIKYRKIENETAKEVFVPIGIWNTESIQSDYTISTISQLTQLTIENPNILYSPTLIEIQTQELYQVEESTSPLPLKFTIDSRYPIIEAGENVNLSISSNINSLEYTTYLQVQTDEGADITNLFYIYTYTINEIPSNKSWVIVPSPDFWRVQEKEIFIKISISFLTNDGLLKSINSPKIGYLLKTNSNFELHTFFPFEYEEFTTNIVSSEGDKNFPVGYILKWGENYISPLIIKPNKIVLQDRDAETLLPLSLLYSETVESNHQLSQLVHKLYPFTTETLMFGIWNFKTQSEYSVQDLSLGMLYQAVLTPGNYLITQFNKYQHDLVKLLNLQTNGKIEYAFVTNEDQDYLREPDTVYLNTGEIEQIEKVQCNWFTTNNTQLYGIAFRNPSEIAWVYVKLPFPQELGNNFNILKITDLSGNIIPEQLYWINNSSPKILNLVYPSTASSGTFYVYFQKNQEINHPPVAIISPSYTELYRPERLTLDASASYDEDGDMISYRWQIVSKPYDSLTYLRYANTPNPLFIADVPGEYTIELVISDGTLLSEPAYATVNVKNRPPTIEIQGRERVRPRESVTLDASSSFDADGDPVEFLWRLTSKPEGSRVTLQNIYYPTISFTPDILGTYEITLYMSDGYDETSAIWTVNAYNNKPQVSLDYQSSVYLNQNVVISAKNTYDADGDTLSFNWLLKEKPDGSNVSLIRLSNETVSFTADKRGTYKISLTVDDSYEKVEFEPLINCINRSPETLLTPSATEIPHGKEVIIDAFLTNDPDGDELKFDWELSLKPIRSSAELYLLAKDISKLIPDAPGTYKVKVTVEDGYNGADSDEITINATNSPPRCICQKEYNSYVGDPILITCEDIEEPENDKLYYHWSITKKPTNSNLDLTSDETLFVFVADKKGDYIAQLEVSDEWGASSQCDFPITIGNRPPISQIRILTTPIYVGNPVVLTSINSTDSDGDEIVSREWKIISKPSQSISELDTTSNVETKFIPDKKGVYSIQLSVFDGTNWSSPTAIEIIPTNRPPSAVITSPDILEVNKTCTLSGLNSFDPDDDEISYLWNIVDKPRQSKAVIDNPTSENISFVPDYPGFYIIRLTVSDGESVSEPAQVTLRTSNLPPIARISAPALTSVGVTPTIDGSGSYDPDGDPLTYRWQLISKPPESQTSLSSLTNITTSIYIDQPGTYQIALQVSDGKSFSDIAKAFISTGNVPPVAIVNQDLKATLGTPCYLDASQSYDPNYDPLIYIWSFTQRPERSLVELIEDDTPHPYFIPDVEGLYKVQLIVSDGKLYSKPVIVSISTINSPPIAQMASSDIFANVGDTVTLDASQSYDPDGDDISFHWNLTSIPENSSASLSNTNEPITTITLDKKGFYQGNLTVYDSHTASNSIPFSISCNNHPPIAIISSPQHANIGDILTLDASQSYDPDDEISKCEYEWRLISKPSNSYLELTNPKQLKITLVPDAFGNYEFEFEIKDPENAYDRKSIFIEVKCVPPKPPKGVSASDGEHHDKIVITWEPSEGAKEYMVFMNTENDPASATPISGWIPSLYWEDQINPDQFSDENSQNKPKCGCVNGCQQPSDTQTYKEIRYYWVISRINDSCMSEFSEPDSGYVEVNIEQKEFWHLIKQFMSLPLIY